MKNKYMRVVAILSMAIMLLGIAPQSFAATGGTLVVALDAANPAGRTLPAGSVGIEFMRVTLTASGGDGAATGFSISGSATRLSDFTAFRVFDAQTGSQIGNTLIPDQNGQGNIGFSVSMLNGSSKTFSIKADVAGSAVSGDTMGLTLTTVSYSGFTAISGLLNNKTLPGNVFMVGNAYTPNLTVSAGSSPTGASFTRGVVDSQVLANFNLSAAVKTVSISNIRLTCVGCSDQTQTGATNDFYSLLLYDGNSVLPSPTISGNTYDFNFPSGLVVSGNSIKALAVRAQVMTSVNVTTNETFHLQLSLASGSIQGEISPAAIAGTPTDAPSNTIVPPAAKNSGNIFVGVDPNTPITQTLMSGSTNTLFFIFKLQATVGDANISGIELTADNNPSDYVSNIQIMDGTNSLATAGTFTLKSGVYTSTLPLSQITITAGSYKILRLVVNVNTTPKNGSLKFGISNFTYPSAVSIFANGPVVYGYPMLFGTGSLSPSPGNTSAPVSTTFKDGDLIVDHGTVYILENSLKRAFVSATVFSKLGYKFSNVLAGDLSNYSSGSTVSDSSARHPRGALIISNGTIYFLGAAVRYPFPSAAVFLSWSNRFQDVVPANASDLQIPVGPVATGK